MKPLSPVELEALLARAYTDPEGAEALLHAAGIEGLDRAGLLLACGSFARKRAHRAHHQRGSWWRRLRDWFRSRWSLARGRPSEPSWPR